MDLYIDIENLKSFVHSKDKEGYDDCLRMLCRQLHLIYNSDKATIKLDEELLPWVLKISNQGRGNSENKDSYRSEKFPDRPIKSNSCKDWSRKELTSVYLIKDMDISKLKNRGCVLLGDEGEELEILTRLFCGSDYDYHHLYDLRKNFPSWEQLTDDNQLQPCTDIVINDRYLFKNEESLVAYNLSCMLRALANNVKNRINVVIFTYYDSLKVFGIDKASKIVKQALESITGVKPNVTFVTSNDSKNIPHDRFVITNYRLLRSGDSFVYFDTQGKLITNGGSLDVDSLANNETFVFVESLLEKLQNSYNEILKLNNSDLIIGAKSSKFINFQE